MSKPPGSFETEPSNSQIATAAGPSTGEPGRNRTPSSMASREMLASSSGVGISAARSARAIITRARVTRSRREICFT